MIEKDQSVKCPGLQRIPTNQIRGTMDRVSSASDKLDLDHLRPQLLKITYNPSYKIAFTD